MAGQDLCSSFAAEIMFASIICSTLAAKAIFGIALFDHSSVLGRVLVAVLALVAIRCDPAFCVHLSSHSFEVRRIYAGMYTAEMVYL